MNKTRTRAGPVLWGGLLLVGWLMAAGGVTLAAEGSTTDGIALLDPFSLQVRHVTVRSTSPLVVLRSSVAQRAVGAQPRLTERAGSTTAVIFRNSVVVMPIMPQVKSGMYLDE